MTVRAEDIDGSKVINSKDGTQIGTVKTLVLDIKQRRFTALEVNRKDRSDKIYILISDTQAISKDTVLVADESKFKNIDELPEEVSDIVKDQVSTTYLIGKKVVTSGGSDAGVVRDAEFDSNTGEVTGLIVSTGITDLISGRKQVKMSEVRTIGDDLLLVSKTPERNPTQEVKSNVLMVDTRTENVTNDPELKDVVGKYVYKNILLPSDEVLIKRGDIITYSTAKRAKEQNLLEELQKYSNLNPPQ